MRTDDRERQGQAPEGWCLVVAAGSTVPRGQTQGRGGEAQAQAGGHGGKACADQQAWPNLRAGQGYTPWMYTHKCDTCQDVLGRCAPACSGGQKLWARVLGWERQRRPGGAVKELRRRRGCSGVALATTELQLPGVRRGTADPHASPVPSPTHRLAHHGHKAQ